MTELAHVARVSLGPATRRGLLDKGGAEVTGGVVIARYGANPLATIQAVKEKIAQNAPGLTSKVLADGTKSQLTIVPFYDRTQLDPRNTRHAGRGFVAVDTGHHPGDPHYGA